MNRYMDFEFKILGFNCFAVGKIKQSNAHCRFEPGISSLRDQPLNH